MPHHSVGVPALFNSYVFYLFNGGKALAQNRSLSYGVL